VFLKVLPSVIGHIDCGMGNINPGPTLTNKLQPLISAAGLDTFVSTCILFTGKTHVTHLHFMLRIVSVDYNR
jgi:hypothetical protein